MGKIVLFEEVSRRVLEEIAKEEDLIRRGLKKPIETEGPILYGIRNYVFLPVEKEEGKTETTKDFYDVIFHTQKRSLPWEKLKPFRQGKFTIYPIATVPNPKITEIDDDFIYPFIYNLHQINPDLSTFTVSNPEPKYKIEDGKKVKVSPNLDFFRVFREKGVSIDKLTGYFHMTEEFFCKSYPKNPEETKTYFQKVRDQIKRVHSPPNTYV